MNVIVKDCIPFRSGSSGIKRDIADYSLIRGCFYWFQRAFYTVIARVAGRVAQGGHNIPENVIRRRFTQGLLNFNNLYQPAVDAWILYDNSANIPTILEWGNKQ